MECKDYKMSPNFCPSGRASDAPNDLGERLRVASSPKCGLHRGTGCVRILVMRFSLFLLALFAVGLVALASACDIIVHVKSDTDKKFSAQVLAPNGKKSDKWNYSHKKERNTFQQKASECGLKDWEISTFENGKLNSTVKVSLNGIGRVTYLVGDNLIPTMKDRQGAICNGQCAPLSPK
ncbi:hypothetical protein QR680_005763 [Steinernema hermaphroditum]|uniref:Uncharacterized protein n=1 Tax=Steinernema hermaphroditum TaxID=289476 RepID=A0AA39HT85_9BILA|nr:hypothetical protein QR680_005763 [Steinernema hermaphroditum]